MRINKYLAECGVCSRRKADELVKSGVVSVNKKVVTEVGANVDEASDVVYVNGKKVVRITHYDYIMFNKPKRCVTTMNDDADNKSGRPKVDDEVKKESKQRWAIDDQRYEDKDSKKSEGKKPANLKADKKAPDKDEDKPQKPRRTVMDYIDKAYKERRVYPVGRLDYDSEGLLILTNDGELSFALTHPSREIPKTYIVKIEGSISESDLAILRKGVKVGDVKFNKCKVKVTGVDKESTRLEVVLTEGKNREIRRMFEAVEKNVILLKRVAIGDLRLGGLSRGGSRELSESEVAYLKKLSAKKADND